MNRASFCARLLAVAMASGVSVSAVAAPMSGQGTWETSLQARDWAGNGVGVDAYYDPFLNITWLKDANFARTSGFDADGFMTFSAANAWAANLELFGGSDWRLPTVTPVNDTAAFNTAFSNNGSTDRGYARTGAGWGEDSELGYMYYVHLGNEGFCTPNDVSPGSCVVQSGFGLANTGPFANLLPDAHWTDRAFASSDAWFFDFNVGNQNGDDETFNNRAWAVHAGDLIGAPAAPTPQAVPLPWVAALGLSALLALSGTRARRR